jgi:hypothetical protein
MDAVIELLTIENITILVLGLTAIWLLRTVVKKDKRRIFSAVVFLVIALAAYIYINQSDMRKFNVTEIGSLLSPGGPEEMKYRVETRESGISNVGFTRYVFEDPKPKLKLTLDKSGYFHLNDVSLINKFLKSVGLPQVEEGRRELASITGSNLDLYMYRWDDYEPGILVVERALCKSESSLTSYQCLAHITITKRY